MHDTSSTTKVLIFLVFNAPSNTKYLSKVVGIPIRYVPDMCPMTIDTNQ